MYRAIRKRRRTSLTNYKKRIAMLKSGMQRVIVRRSNRNILMQIVKYEENGDKVVMSVNSKELAKFDWTPKSNTPTAYLTGLMLAKKAKAINEEFVLDIGLYKPIKSSVLFAAAKGAVDGGMKIKSNIEFDEKRLSGSHISDKVPAMFENAKKKLTM